MRERVSALQRGIDYGQILARLVRSQSACYARRGTARWLALSLLSTACHFQPPFTGFPRHA
jgi:hypothetical protein